VLSPQPLEVPQVRRGDERRVTHVAEVERRKLKLKAKFESNLSYCSFKCLVPGAFNMGLIGSTCPAPPKDTWSRMAATNRLVKMYLMAMMYVTK